MNRCGSMTAQSIINTNDSLKKSHLGTVILLEGLNRFHGTPTSPSVQMWMKTHRCLGRPLTYPCINKLLTRKVLKQGYQYHKLRKTFSNCYRRYYDLISKFQVGLKSLMRQGLSEPEFYGDLVYKSKKIVYSHNFSAQFIKINSH